MAQRQAMLSIQATPDITNIRTASLYGQECTVIPCVALVEGVLWAANGPAPELALASEFGRFAAGWNGQPVVYDHPKVDGIPVAANSPEILENNSFGQLFNTKLDGKKLRTEIWINNARVTSMSEDAQEVIADLQTPDNVVEVSTGLFTMSEDSPGIYDGTPYTRVWRNVVPDHLAILPKGIKGACSIEHGCGAPVTNSMQPAMRAAELNTTTPVLTTDTVTITTSASSEPECECPDVTPEEKGMLMKFLEFTRILTSPDSTNVDGSTSPIVSTEPVVNESTTIQENVMNEELVNDLITNEGTQFSEDEREWLSSLDEDQLKKLSPVVNSEPTTPPPAVAEPEAPAAPVSEPVVTNASPITTDAYIADAPEEIRQVLNSGLKMHRDRKDALIEGLTANARCKFTAEQLQAKDIEELENITALASDISFEGQATTLSVNTAADEDAPPPAPEIFSTNPDQDKE